MTANTSLVSNRTTQPPSAVQARANAQTAAIALLGAGNSIADRGEASFADSLQSESKRHAPSQGLFSDKANAPRPDPRAQRLESEPGRRDQSNAPKASTQVDPRTGPISGRPRSEKPQPAAADEGPIETPSILNQTSAFGEASSTQSLSPTISLANAAVQNPQTGNVTDPADTSSQQADNAGSAQKSQRATDPLRLIAPQQQASGVDAPTSPQAPGAQAIAQSATISQASTKPAPVRRNEGANPVHAPNQTGTLANASAPGQGTPLQPSSSAQSGGAVGGVSGATVTGARTTVGGPIDPVVPPRTGNGRPIEQPVTLKLRLGPQVSNAASQLSQAEITAAETQIGRGLTAAFRQNTPQVTLWMSPETLGKVRIQLTFDQGTISARFEATSDATKDLLAQNMGALRDALQSRGLTANQIEVVSIPDWSQQGGSQSGSNQSSGQPASNQTSSGDHSASGQGGQSQQNPSEHSKGWAALPHGDAVSKPETESGAQVAISMDARLMTLNAHLELDAVA